MKKFKVNLFTTGQFVYSKLGPVVPNGRQTTLNKAGYSDCARLLNKNQLS